jgi:hypothetical protein
MIKSSMMGISMFQYVPTDSMSTTLIGIIGNRAVILEGKNKTAETAPYCGVRHKCF